MSSPSGQGLDPVAALSLSQQAGPDILPTGGNQNVQPTAGVVSGQDPLINYTPFILMIAIAFFIYWKVLR